MSHKDLFGLRALPRACSRAISARATQLVDYLTPAGADPELRRRSRVLIAFVAILDAAVAICVPLDLVSGHWASGLTTLVAALGVTLSLGWLRVGRVALVGHIVSATFVLVLLAISDEKGGLVATEIAWQCAAIVLAVLVLGPRGALPWTLVACAGVVYYALQFDPGHWTGGKANLTQPLAYALEIVMLYFATWGLAFAFDRMREDYLRRLHDRAAEMRRVLEHARDGLLTIDRDGRIGRERSAQASTWFGPLPPDATLWQVLGRDTPGLEDWLALCWEAVVDDTLPRELAVAQLPKRVKLAGRTLSLSLTPIDNDSALTGALVVLHDVTDEVARQSAERERADALAIFEQIRTDAAAVADFLVEMDRLARSVKEGGDADVLLRDIHTLKGNAALFGVQSIAALCHAIEERCAQESDVPTEAERTELAQLWGKLSSEFSEWSATIRGRRHLTITRSSVEELRESLQARMPHAQLAAQLDQWDKTPVERVLARLARQGAALAERMDKAVDFVVQASDARVDAGELGGVLSALAHVVRNALDHGVEATDERHALGKPARGRIQLASHVADDHLVIEVLDDGRGVDWEAVRRRAAARGLSSTTDSELAAALFSPGFTTRSCVTPLSGRGMGLAALRDAVAELGGTVGLHSTPSRGSRVSARIPLRAAAPAPIPLRASA